MKDIKQDDLTEEERVLYLELFGDGDSEPEEQPRPTERRRRHGFTIVMMFILIAASIGAYAWYAMQTYKDYEVKQEVVRNDEERIGYLNFKGNLFSFSRDGASYSDYDDILLWSESFDMENPVADICGDYLLLYDRQRTQTILFNVSGVVNEQVMTLPIVSASVAQNGRIAVLMQDKDTGYLQLFESDGSIVASGELHMKNTGYPIAMDISNSGTKMLVSVLNLNDGDIKTTLSFYDFSDAGGKAANRIVANFSYADMVVPRVVFGAGDKAVAFGDDEMIFFTGSGKPKVRTEVFFSSQIKSVMFNDRNVGVITLTGEGEESLQNILSVYTMNGKLRYETPIGDNYTVCMLNENNEVVLTDRENINIYTKYGIHKYSHVSEETVYAILPWDGATNYYLIRKKVTEKIKLR
ncbi:MAG: hypothetical protein IJT32_06985 [Lachnospiraceae bacterium]|nr:hypothetical protein [Lachnospiraceae bacterium]